MRSWIIRQGAAAALAIVSLAGSLEARAQDATHRNLFSLNPLGIPFEYFSGEYERMLSPLATFGIQGSYFSPDEGSYSTGEVKLRFYPNEEAFRGFSLGLAAGITRRSDLEYDPSLNGDRRVNETRPTLAVIVDYNWVLGKAKRVIVGAGVGAKRIMGAEADFSDLPDAYPTARFQIGVRY